MGAWIEISPYKDLALICDVALYMGVWIEIFEKRRRRWIESVAVYMGAWIEISMIFWVLMMVHVALYMGARINICTSCPIKSASPSRTLHGCADQHGKYGWLVVMASDCTF